MFATDRHLSCDVVSADGAVMQLRRLSLRDGPAMLEFYRALTVQEIRLRFFSARLPSDAALLLPLQATRPDDIVLGIETRGRLVAVGVATASVISPLEAPEVAFAVAADQRRRGLATLLLEHLVDEIREAGHDHVAAVTKASNNQMLEVFRQVGYALVTDVDSDGVHFLFDIRSRVDVERPVNDRTRTAVANSIRPLLAPASIAVVGDAATIASVRDRAARIRAAGFLGDIQVIDRSATSPSVVGPVDLVVVDIADAESLSSVVEACGQAGAAGVAVVAPGPGVAAAQAARRCGMRLLGPCSAGTAAEGPQGPVHTVDSGPTVGQAGIALGCDGEVGDAVLKAFADAGAPIVSFVALGEAVDVTASDLLQFWADDASSQVVALEVRSLGDPRRFARVARECGARKPVVVRLSPWPNDLPSRSVLADWGLVAVESRGELIEVAQRLCADRSDWEAGASAASRAASIDLHATAAVIGDVEREGRRTEWVTSIEAGRLLHAAGIELPADDSHGAPAVAEVSIRGVCDDRLGPVVTATSAATSNGPCRTVSAPMDLTTARELTDFGWSRKEVGDQVVQIARHLGDLLHEECRLRNVGVHLVIGDDGSVRCVSAGGRFFAGPTPDLRRAGTLEPIGSVP